MSQSPERPDKGLATQVPLPHFGERKHRSVENEKENKVDDHGSGRTAHSGYYSRQSRVSVGEYRHSRPRDRRERSRKNLPRLIVLSPWGYSLPFHRVEGSSVYLRGLVSEREEG